MGSTWGKLSWYSPWYWSSSWVCRVFPVTKTAERVMLSVRGQTISPVKAPFSSSAASISRTSPPLSARKTTDIPGV